MSLGTLRQGEGPGEPGPLTLAQPWSLAELHREQIAAEAHSFQQYWSPVLFDGRLASPEGCTALSGKIMNMQTLFFNPTVSFLHPMPQLSFSISKPSMISLLEQGNEPCMAKRDVARNLCPVNVDPDHLDFRPHEASQGPIPQILQRQTVLLLELNRPSAFSVVLSVPSYQVKDD
ncbi:hypothetical protein MC885_020998 [Smutsia gigantea]|nr:hypothetical protein MC885_020998 [Smutsia gigantea]